MTTTTTDTAIFEKMDLDSVLRNHEKYVKALADTAQADRWPGLKYGLELCRDAMKNRGIDITQYPINIIQSPKQ